MIVTDYNDDELRSAAREAGACAFALKHNLTNLDDVLLQACAPPLLGSAAPTQI